jgi:nucleoside-diphosphate kinase
VEDEINMTEQTLAIIKPDAVKKDAIGDIISRYEKAGLKPVAVRMLRMSKPVAEGFYDVHRQRPFFDSLTTFMASGPVVVLVLEGKDAIKRNRELMGATDPGKAAPGTIRAVYGTNIEFNAVHGSDSAESARVEINYFFSSMELGV